LTYFPPHEYESYTHPGCRLLLLPTNIYRPSSLACSAESNAVEPVRQRRAGPDDSSPPSQNQKGCLECVLGVGMAPQHPSTDSEHHRPMPTNQMGKRLAILTRQEPFQQLAIGFGFDAADEAPKPERYHRVNAFCHVAPSLST
jgi:hypothetical protein